MPCGQAVRRLVPHMQKFPLTQLRVRRVNATRQPCASLSPLGRGVKISDPQIILPLHPPARAGRHYKKAGGEDRGEGGVGKMLPNSL